VIGLLGGTPGEHECSRAGCKDEASWALLWRNPKLHVEDRRKTWLSCSGHLDYLQGFLEARSFPLEVVSLDSLVAEQSMTGRSE